MNVMRSTQAHCYIGAIGVICSFIPVVSKTWDELTAMVATCSEHFSRIREQSIRLAPRSALGRFWATCAGVLISALNWDDQNDGSDFCYADGLNATPGNNEKM
jgi:hypothetical protein